MFLVHCQKYIIYLLPALFFIMDLKLTHLSQSLENPFSLGIPVFIFEIFLHSLDLCICNFSIVFVSHNLSLREVHVYNLFVGSLGKKLFPHPLVEQIIQICFLLSPIAILRLLRLIFIILMFIAAIVIFLLPSHVTIIFFLLILLIILVLLVILVPVLFKPGKSSFLGSIDHFKIIREDTLIITISFCSPFLLLLFLFFLFPLLFFLLSLTLIIIIGERLLDLIVGYNEAIFTSTIFTFLIFYF